MNGRLCLWARPVDDDGRKYYDLGREKPCLLIQLDGLLAAARFPSMDRQTMHPMPSGCASKIPSTHAGTEMTQGVSHKSRMEVILDHSTCTGDDGYGQRHALFAQSETARGQEVARISRSGCFHTPIRLGPISYSHPTPRQLCCHAAPGARNRFVLGQACRQGYMGEALNPYWGRLGTSGQASNGKTRPALTGCRYSEEGRCDRVMELSDPCITSCLFHLFFGEPGWSPRQNQFLASGSNKRPSAPCRFLKKQG
jgi:hypothetical protein